MSGFVRDPESCLEFREVDAVQDFVQGIIKKNQLRLGE